LGRSRNVLRLTREGRAAGTASECETRELGHLRGGEEMEQAQGGKGKKNLNASRRHTPTTVGRGKTLQKRQRGVTSKILPKTEKKNRRNKGTGGKGHEGGPVIRRPWGIGNWKETKSRGGARVTGREKN